MLTVSILYANLKLCDMFSYPPSMCVCLFVLLVFVFALMILHINTEICFQ